MILELFKEKIEKADSRIPCVIDFLKNYEYSSSDFGMFFLEPETLKSQSINLKHDKTHERTLKLLYIAPVDVSWAPEFDIKYQITFLENLMKQLSKDEDILKEIKNLDYVYALKPRETSENSYMKEIIFEIIITIKEK
ncbi:Uncharacterised protein [Sebaldella termitidis]|jgi:hypothetical protein|uniref:Uncharacterized protein n=1 Tax=Sebaldella termitidis (strain ATCC 33386 / NCTC 11300) TaxID=526218 RepID=D1AJP0_SEBTE|nr:hypothetical protein [Sebaldella termitidis]ACZ06947.1 hypothetical protein Sterm_0059 [Sebaldella termitidis ATCC 33386]SUI22236.1 Uncharacterised protein [Sebaldella termitidis]